MHDTLVTAVVPIDEKWLPLGRELVRVQRIPMILRRDVALVGEQVHNGLVLAAIAERELVGLRPGCQPQELVSLPSESLSDVQDFPLHY